MRPPALKMAPHLRLRTDLPLLLTLCGLSALAQPQATKMSVGLRCAASQVGRYERVDFALDVPGTYANPFDPDQVEVNLRIEAPSGRVLTLPAFWGQDYERRQLGPRDGRQDWIYPIGMPHWQARFAPTAEGQYEVTAIVKNHDGSFHSKPVHFACIASNKPGFIRVSRSDPRFLEFSGGKAFFPIGQNLAFIGSQQYVTLSKAEEIFRRLAENGANYLRVWTCCGDWAMAIEDVNRPERGFYNPLDCYLLDEVVSAAQKEGIFLQLCLLTRDLYMDALKDPAGSAYTRAIQDAKKTFRYAIARWGYATSVAAWEYWNEMNPGLPTDRFYTELGDYLAQADPYHHLRTTSTWGPSAKDCHHPKLDIADAHFYLRPSDKGRLRDEVDAVLERTRWLRGQAPNKPVQLGEFGIANEKWGLTDEMRRSHRLIDVHNALWASALSGASGTALFWWWERLDQLDAYPLYRPVSRFIASIPWTSGQVRRAEVTCADSQVQPVGLRASDRAWLWLFAHDASWASVVSRGKQPKSNSRVGIRLAGMPEGAYEVQWWDTRKGTVIRQDAASAKSGLLQLCAPDFVGDIACAARRLAHR